MSPETATSLDDLRWLQARRLARLVDAGVVHEIQPGRYYLEIPALAERMTSRRRRVAILLLLMVAAMTIAMYIAGIRFVRF